MAIIKGNKWCSFWCICSFISEKLAWSLKNTTAKKCVFGIMKLMPFGDLIFLHFINEAVQKQIFITPPVLIECATVHNWLMNAWLNTTDVRICGRKQHCMVWISFLQQCTWLYMKWCDGEIHDHQWIFYFDLFWIQDKSQSIQKLSHRLAGYKGASKYAMPVNVQPLFSMNQFTTVAHFTISD